MGERNLSSRLLPKLALLLDIDVNHLVLASLEENDRVGLICIQDIELSQKVYDKPWFTIC